MSVLWIALAVVAAQRIVTVIYSARNTKKMLAAGGVEVGKAQFPMIALAQFAWLASMAIIIPAHANPNWWILGAAAIVEIFHCRAIASLGPYWSTRVVLVPGARLVRRGPYGILRHPNYAAVLAEIVLLPLAFGRWDIALIFGALYAALILWRVRDEDRLLAPAR